jgi:putative phosphoesterase
MAACSASGSKTPAQTEPRLISVGVISDTHGLLRPEALDALLGSDAIVHAGDVGGEGILEQLSEIAPVTAVRGNVDRGDFAGKLSATELLELGGTRIWVLHNLSDMDLYLRPDGVGVIVSGHTHTPLIREEDGVLYLNPGSAGPRRFRLPVAVARLTLGEGPPRAAIVELPSDPA